MVPLVPLYQRTKISGTGHEFQSDMAISGVQKENFTDSAYEKSHHGDRSSGGMHDESKHGNSQNLNFGALGSENLTPGCGILSVVPSPQGGGSRQLHSAGFG